MIFTPLYPDGPVVIELEKKADERGFFARSFCVQEFEAAGLPTDWPQSNISFNAKKATVRGMHFQLAPYEEPKVVRCTSGALYDVVIDLRPSSAHYCKAVGVELSALNHKALYVPPGFAHGFQTLMDDTEVLYLMGAYYQADAARGVRWNDPAFDVSWPLSIEVISERDAAYPDFVSVG